MRIAVLATSYPSVVGDPSGHFVRAEALAWVASGHDVHVIAPSPCADPGVVVHAAGGAQLFTWPGAVERGRQNPRRIAGAAHFLHGARRALAQIRPDHVVAHWMVPSAWPIVASVRATSSLEIVCHGADVRLLLGLPSDLRAHVVRTVLERSPEIRFVAGALRDALATSLEPSLCERLLACSRVAIPRVCVQSAEAPAPGQAPFSVTAARLIPGKRVDLAIQAMAEARASRLVILGDGPERPRLERMADQLCPGKVLFRGTIPRPEALGWIQAAHALVHLSEIDAAPTAILEARALGTRVVAADVGAVRDWALADPGIVLVSREVQSVSSAIDRMMAAESCA